MRCSQPEWFDGYKPAEMRVIRRLVTRYWMLLPLLIGVVVLLDRVETPDAVPTEATIDMRTTQSDYYLEQFRTRRFSPDGEIEYQVQGETLAHFPDDDRSEIVEPRLEVRREEVTWLIESERGRFDPQPSLFTMNGNVSVKRHLGSEQATALSISTESLRIATDDNLVETDALVRIDAPGWNIQALGMRTAINEGRLTLLSRVSGRFEAPQQQPAQALPDQ